ncbi:hypothetical protein KIPB_014982, partial [Kipferlia bialata]
ASDVNVDIVGAMRDRLRHSIKLKELPPEANRRDHVQRAVVKEIVELLEPKTKPHTLVRQKPNVVMFVGLQGAGKTTTVAKYAAWHRKRGWRVGIICADTFRAGAFDQLKQNAIKAKVPYFG